MTATWNATALTGGTTGCLDAIATASISHMDRAIVTVAYSSTYHIYVFVFDATSVDAENSPYVVRPDDFSTAGTWKVLNAFYDQSGTILTAGNLVDDPQSLPWHVAAEGMVFIPSVEQNQALILTMAQAITAAGAWTDIANYGDTTQVTVDDTYATVTNVASGAGVLTHLFLPGATTAADVVTARITVDSTEYTLAFTLVNATDRFFAGVAKMQTYIRSTGGAVGGELTQASWGGGIESGIANRAVASVGLLPMAPAEALQGGGPLLRFESSLLVEMKSSDFSATNNRDYCAAVYTLDQY